MENNQLPENLKVLFKLTRDLDAKAILATKESEKLLKESQSHVIPENDKPVVTISASPKA